MSLLVSSFIRLLFQLALLSRLGLQICSTFDVTEEYSEDYCLTETFQPRCQKNELILMQSATYGRMRVGRCIPAEEVDALGARYLGCSADVLSLMDRKCSGKTECSLPIIQISAENIKPCFSGLSVYLEASYTCLTITDEKRSCAVDVSTTPIHIIGSKTCGIKSQPWIVEAPVGQKISVSLVVFPTSNSTQTYIRSEQSCHNYGVIVDKIGKRNTTICTTGTQREKKLYLSAGNAIDVFLSFPEEERIIGDERHVMLSFRAVGCSDIIPPEDAYVKRSGDAVAVGCYTSRKSWHLRCEDGRWTGIIGNCLSDNSLLETDTFSEPRTSSFSNDQVLVILAVGGFTLAICLAIVCFGAVCLRRMLSRKNAKPKQDCKTLDYRFLSNGNRQLNSVNCNLTGGDVQEHIDHAARQAFPTYSVFVEDDDFNGANSVDINNTNP